MTVEVTTKKVFDQNSTNISVSIIQSGDEAAYDIDAYSFVSEEFSADGSLNATTLNSGETLQGDFTISVNENVLQGTYPFVVLVRYYDANRNHPFSLVASHLLNYGEESSSDVYAEFSEELEITGKDAGEALLTIRNIGYSQRYVKLKLYLPIELKSDVIEKNVIVGPRDEKEIKINIESFGATTGSSYGILASLEYEDGDFHYSSLVAGRVEIVEEKENSYIFLIAIVAFIVLILVFIYYSLKRRK